MHDWRGQGLSDRLLADPLAGHADGYDDFLSDYRRLLARFEDRLARPWIAFGHSMGGCLALLALAKGESRFSAAILSAPMLGLATGAAPAWAAHWLARAQEALGRAGLPAAATAVAPERFDTNILTHDEKRYRRNQALLAAAPQLALGPPTWGWVAFALAAVGELQRGGGVTRIGIPVTIAIAGEERLVDNAGARRVAGRMRRARLVEIAGAYHEILQETDAVRHVFLSEFDAVAARLQVSSESPDQP